MSDNILSAVLTFSLMAGGTVAIGSEMFNSHPVAAPTTSVTLAPVTIIGHRASVVAVADVVTLPTVTIIGHRELRTEVAVDTHGAAPTVE